MAYASIAKTVIIPMQDVLGLGIKSRMNLPSTTKGNWTWRMKKRQLNKKHADKLHKLVQTFGRDD
jgi:4-alpha-glucanotransferase